MDFAELKNDTNFVSRVDNINQCLDKIENNLNIILEFKDYDSLSMEERVKLDLLQTYSVNSLYWMYLKLQGLDLGTYDIKNELSRVRQTMLREKQIHERNTIRPVLNVPAAKRFIKHGLHDRSGRNVDENNKTTDES